MHDVPFGSLVPAEAGGHLPADTCPAISRVMPKGTKVVATDSAKQAHDLPAIADPDQDPLAVIGTGDHVVADAGSGEVRVTKRG
jgi:hypothetical protein